MGQEYIKKLVKSIVDMQPITHKTFKNTSPDIITSSVMIKKKITALSILFAKHCPI